MVLTSDCVKPKRDATYFFIAFCQETVLMFFFLKVGYSSDFLHFNILI